MQDQRAWVFAMLIAVAGIATPGATLRQSDRGQLPASPPPPSRHDEKGGTNVAASAEDHSDPVEWSLLHAAAAGASEALGPLARYYEDRQAWDEYSAVRARMLENLPPDRGPGPIPGGPFPRIGRPHDDRRRRTVLSRWLNDAALPELFAKREMTQRALEKSLRALPPSAETRRRLADVLCSELLFAEAATLYEQALADREQPQVRAHLNDVHRIIKGQR
jgi:hypothetical protein